MDLDAVREIIGRAPLTTSVVRRLNPDLSPADLIADLRGIGCPAVLT